MEKSKIIEAKKEAQRFINKVNELEKRLEEENKRLSPYAARKYTLSYTKESGAVRRASMDLTRALAEMRKPQRY